MWIASFPIVVVLFLLFFIHPVYILSILIISADTALLSIVFSGELEAIAFAGCWERDRRRGTDSLQLLFLLIVPLPLSSG
jgi:hypothetical protein